MRSLKTISWFKIAIIIFLALYFDKFYIYFLGLLIFNKKEKIFSILIFIVAILFNYCLIDFVPIGYIKQVEEKYIIVDKILYKNKIYVDNNFEVGNIVYCKNGTLDNTLNTKQNIRFLNDNENLKILIKDTPLSLIYKRCETFDLDISSALKKIIFNEYTDDFNLGFGLALYYCLDYLIKHNKKIGILSFSLAVILFGFDIKFYLIILNLLFANRLDKVNKIGAIMIFVICLNYNLILNYSIFLPLIFKLKNYINNLDLSYIIQSFLFCEIKLLYSFLYTKVILIRIIVFLFSLLIMFFHINNPLILSFYKYYSILNNILDLSIRGKISIFTFIIILIFNYFYKGKFKKILINSILIIGLVTNINEPFAKISFIDVGQGDAILLKSFFNSNTILIDTGSKYNYSKLKKYLYSQGIYRIDYLIITHDDSDHNGNIDSLKNNFKIDNFIDVAQDVASKDFYLKNIFLGNFDNDNDNSLIYFLEYQGISFLFTGDLSKEKEELIDIGNVDVLKVGHHGSNTSTSREFISKLLPDVAIISTSGMYNHPKEEVLTILDNFLVKIFITKDDGDIEFYFTPFFRFIKTKNDFVIIEE